MAYAGASIEIFMEIFQDLPRPPTTQAEVLRPPFQMAFNFSQRVEIDGLLDVGYFAPIDGEKLPKGRNIVAGKWVHTYRADEQGYCVKTKSRPVAKGFSQVAGVDYNKTTYLTPAVIPVKMITAVTNEKDLLVNHLDVCQHSCSPSERKHLYASSSWLWCTLRKSRAASKVSVRSQIDR